jgi:hypothetical protein
MENILLFNLSGLYIPIKSLHCPFFSSVMAMQVSACKMMYLVLSLEESLVVFQLYFAFTEPLVDGGDYGSGAVGVNDRVIIGFLPID